VYFAESFTVQVKYIVISVVKMIYVSVELCCIYTDLNFGLASIETQCRCQLFCINTAFNYYE